MRTCKLAFGAVAALMMLGPVAVGADDPPPYASATDAYRQGVSTIKAGKVAAALPALEYAAKHGVLGAELKLARIYSSGRDDVAEDDAKAFTYFQAIADQYADISPSNPGRPICRRGVRGARPVSSRWHRGDAASRPIRLTLPTCSATPRAISAMPTRNTLSPGSISRATASRRMSGLAVNWLAMAAKKQHVAAQATLGELLWRGTEVRQREARGLALITLAHENAKASGKEPNWIGDLYQEAFAKSDSATRKEAAALLPELGPTSVASTETPLSVEAGRAPVMLPAIGAAAVKPVAPAAARPSPAGSHPAQQARHAAAGADRALGRLRRPEHRRRGPQALSSARLQAR